MWVEILPRNPTKCERKLQTTRAASRRESAEGYEKQNQKSALLES